MVARTEVKRSVEKDPLPGLSFGLYLPNYALTNDEIASWQDLAQDYFLQQQ